MKLMDDAVSHFGGLDIVCSNSGVVSFGHLGDVTEVGSIYTLQFRPKEKLSRQDEGSKRMEGATILDRLTDNIRTGRIRPRLQHQHPRPILRRPRSLPPSQRRRPHHPDVVQHGQGL